MKKIVVTVPVEIADKLRQAAIPNQSFSKSPYQQSVDKDKDI